MYDTSLFHVLYSTDCSVGNSLYRNVILDYLNRVQYGRFFDKTNLILTFYCIVSLVYYPLAVYFSHFCYKNFKNSFKGNNQLLPRNGLAGNNDGQVSGGGNYQRVV